MSDSSFGLILREVSATWPSPEIDPRIIERIPSIAEAFTNATIEQYVLASQVVADGGTHEAVRLLFNLAVNDLVDLLHELGTGAGRPAMRTARSLIEHAINLHTVTSNLAEASRYVEHLDLGQVLLASVPLEGLGNKAGRTYRKRARQRGREAQKRFDAAAATHWSESEINFRKSWTKPDLKARADLNGLGFLYGYYRLASLVIHGSSAGSIGLVRETPGPRTFRHGSALELAPIAMLAGLAAYRSVRVALERARPDVPAGGYAAGLNQVDELTPQYFDAGVNIDAALWPTTYTAPPGAVLAFSKTKKRRWYLHIPSLGSLIPADPPDVPPWMEQQFERLIDAVVTEQPHLFDGAQRWVMARILTLVVVPSADQKAIAETSLFPKSTEELVLLEWKIDPPEMGKGHR